MVHLCTMKGGGGNNKITLVMLIDVIDKNNGHVDGEGDQRDGATLFGLGQSPIIDTNFYEFKARPHKVNIILFFYFKY